MTNSVYKDKFSLGNWLVCPLQHVIKDLENPNETQNITANLLSLLLYLASQPNRVVSRDELMKEVWQGNIVSEETISRAIAHLRKLLGDSAKNPQFIRTISRQGYQLLPLPVFLPPAEAQTAASTSSSSNLSKSRQPLIKSMMLAMTLAIVVILLMVTLYPSFNPETTTDEATIPRFAQLAKFPLASDNEYQRHPRFSADGRFIVSVEHHNQKNTQKNNQKDSQQNSSLMIHDLLNDSSQQLFSSAEVYYSDPAFSPDGNEIIYIQTQRKIPGKQRLCGIYVYTFKTRSSRKVMACGQLFKSNFSWTKDGLSVITGWYNPESTTVGLVKIRLKDGKITRLLAPVNDNSGYLFARLSPDNQQIAFVLVNGQTKDNTLTLLDLKTLQLTPLAKQFTNVNQVVWGDDNHTLYFSDSSFQAAGIWHLDLDTGQTRLLYNEKIIDFDLNPLHNTFVGSFTDRDFDIWSATMDNQGEVKHQTISAKKGANEVSPTLTRDGLKLAFVSDHRGANNIWLRDPSTDEEHPLSQYKSGKLRNLRWSADGRLLSFVSTDSSISELIILSVPTLSASYQEVARVSGVSFASWDNVANRMNLVFADPKKVGVYQLNVDTLQQQLLFPTAVLSVETLTGKGYMVQKSYAGPLYQVPLEHINNESAWLPFKPSHQVVNDWRTHDDLISMATIDQQSGREVHFYQWSDGQPVEEFNPLTTRVQFFDYILDLERKTFYYVVGNKQSTHFQLFLIKPF